MRWSEESTVAAAVETNENPLNVDLAAAAAAALLLKDHQGQP